MIHNKNFQFWTTKKICTSSHSNYDSIIRLFKYCIIRKGTSAGKKPTDTLDVNWHRFSFKGDHWWRTFGSTLLIILTVLFVDFYVHWLILLLVFSVFRPFSILFCRNWTEGRKNYELNQSWTQISKKKSKVHPNYEDVRQKFKKNYDFISSTWSQ